VFYITGINSHVSVKAWIPNHPVPNPVDSTVPDPLEVSLQHRFVDYLKDRSEEVGLQFLEGEEGVASPGTPIGHPGLGGNISQSTHTPVHRVHSVELVLAVGPHPYHPALHDSHGPE
jgi:hypothetical protein